MWKLNLIFLIWSGLSSYYTSIISIYLELININFNQSNVQILLQTLQLATTRKSDIFNCWTFMFENINVQQSVDSFGWMLTYCFIQLFIYLRRESIQPVQPVIGISRRRPQVTPQLGKFIPLQTNTLFGHHHQIQFLKLIHS